MSLEQVEAGFSKYEQVRPDGLEELNTVYDEHGATSKTFDRLADAIDSADRPMSNAWYGPRTDDDYEWFASLRYQGNDGDVVVLFPHAQDASWTDGAQLDKSISVYADHGVDETAVEEFVYTVTDTFEQDAYRQEIPVEDGFYGDEIDFLSQYQSGNE